MGVQVYAHVLNKHMYTHVLYMCMCTHTYRLHATWHDHIADTHVCDMSQVSTSAGCPSEPACVVCSVPPSQSLVGVGPLPPGLLGEGIVAVDLEGDRDGETEGEREGEARGGGVRDCNWGRSQGCTPVCIHTSSRPIATTHSSLTLHWLNLIMMLLSVGLS